MFKTMGRIQNVVLIAAGVATAGLFGISITDIQGCSRAGELHSNANLSADERLKISRKLRIGSTLNNRNIPGDQFEAAIEDYARSLNEAQAAGLAVSDKELGAFIHQNFGSKEAYANFRSVMDARYGLKVSELEGYFRDQLLFSKSARLAMLGVYVTENEVKTEYHRRNDRVFYDRVAIDSSAIAIEQAPTEDELKAYFEENSSDLAYQLPEKVAISYILVNPENIDIIPPTDSELQDHYNANLKDFSTSGNVEDATPFTEVKEDILEDLSKQKREDMAKDFLGGLDDLFLEQENIDLLGTFKAQLAIDARLAVAETGTTELFSERDYRIEPMGYVFNLTARLFGDNPRNYGGILEAGSGFYIYHLDRRESARSMTFEEAKASIVASLTETRQLEAAEALGREWKEKLIASGNWSDLELPDSMDYREESVVGLRALEPRALEKVEPKVVTDPIVSGTSVVLMRLIERQAADEAGLEAEKETLRQSLGQQKSYLMMSGLGIR